MKVTTSALLHHFSASSVGVLTAALAIPVLTRLMTQEEYGSYVLATTILTTLHLIAGMWLQVVAGRFVGAHSGGLAAGNLFLPFVASVILAECLLAAITIARPAWLSATAAWLLTALVPLYTLHVTLSERVYLRRETSVYALTAIAYSTMRYGLGVAFVWALSPSTEMMLTAWLVSVTATCAALVMKLPEAELGRAALSSRAVFSRPFFPYSIRLSLANFVANAGAWLPTFLMSEHWGKEAVAAYSVVGVLVPLFISYLPGIYHAAVYPMLIEAHSRGKVPEVRRALMRNLQFSIAVGITGTAFVLLFGTALLRLAAGPAYSVDSAVLVSAAFAALTLSVIRALDPVYKVSLQSARLLKVHLAGGGVTIAATIFCVPNYGVAGAFFAVLAGHGVQVLLAVRDAIQWGFLPLPFSRCRYRQSCHTDGTSAENDF